MNEIAQIEIDSRILEISKIILPDFNKMKDDEVKIFEISSLGIVHRDEEIYRLKIRKLSKKAGFQHFNPTVQFDHLCEIFAADLGGIAHEISHMVYKSSGESRRRIRPITDYLKHCIHPPQTIVDYYSRNFNVYDRLIGYLYLSDDDELTAKLTGFYIDSYLTNHGKLKDDDYTKGIIKVYEEMIEFEPDEKDIDFILESEKAEKVLAEFLDINEAEPDVIKSMAKEINNQGSKFGTNLSILFK